MRPKKKRDSLNKAGYFLGKGGIWWVSGCFFSEKQTVSVLGVGCVLLLTWKNDWLVLSALVLVVGCLRNGC